MAQQVRVNGWLIVDKPVGLGSTQAVSAVKRALREGGYPKARIGHGGTLDPLASGVLPIALGEATKLCGRMLDSDKIYEFTVVFGDETDTLDREGQVVASTEVPSRAAVEAILARFVGAIEQVPPAFSALKIDGKPAYARARAGEQVEMRARYIIVHVLEILDWTGTADKADSVTLRARVSKGTYVRSLARDIARAAGSLGHVSMLRRSRAGPFALESAISLDKLTEIIMARGLEQALLPLTAGLDDIPALPVTPDQARLLRQGQKVIGTAATPGLHLAIDRSVPVALVEAQSEGELRVVRGFNL
jgi:tRNA pseudouridine55 synthase